MMTAWSSKPPLSIAREKRIDRTPRRLSHQKTPACVAEAIVNSRSFPGFTIAPTAPNTHPIRPMKKVTFQNRATLAWRKARSSSLFSLPNERPWLGIRRLLPARPLIARDRASIRARRHELSYVDGMGRPGLRSRDLRSFSRIRPVTATSFWSGRVDSNHRPLDPQGRILIGCGGSDLRLWRASLTSFPTCESAPRPQRLPGPAYAGYPGDTVSAAPL